MPKATETRHAMAEVRDTRAMLRAKKSQYNEQSTLTPMLIETMDATAECSAADDEPTTVAPTVVETMHATGEMRDTKAMPKAKGSKDDEPSTLAPAVIDDAHDV